MISLVLPPEVDESATPDLLPGVDWVCCSVKMPEAAVVGPPSSLIIKDSSSSAGYPATMSLTSSAAPLLLASSFVVKIPDASEGSSMLNNEVAVGLMQVYAVYALLEFRRLAVCFEQRSRSFLLVESQALGRVCLLPAHTIAWHEIFWDDCLCWMDPHTCNRKSLWNFVYPEPKSFVEPVKTYTKIKKLYMSAHTCTFFRRRVESKPQPPPPVRGASDPNKQTQTLLVCC